MKIVCHRRRPALFHPALPPKRSGAVLVVAVIALLTAAVILFGVLKAAVNHYRQIRINRYSVQAQALANAGIDRASPNCASLTSTKAKCGNWRRTTSTIRLPEK